MKLFNDYLDPSISLQERINKAFDDLKFSEERRLGVNTFLEPLKLKDVLTYEHSLRVGLLTKNIGKFMHLDAKALFYAGLLHDIGKALTDPKTLKKTDVYSPADYKEIQHHVKHGYQLLRGYFDFTAEVVWWHHRFQPNKYPKNLPIGLHQYSEGTKVVIPMYGRILSLADCYDALHRVNNKFKEQVTLKGEWIKEKMLTFNPDQKVLISELYEAEIFTTNII